MKHATESQAYSQTIDRPEDWRLTLEDYAKADEVIAAALSAQPRDPENE